jgi:hypothetical protein
MNNEFEKELDDDVEDIELDLEDELEEDELDENVNANTIKAKGTVSKAELLAKMVGYASQLNKSDLAQKCEELLKSGDAIAAENKSSTSMADKSGSNKVSIKSGGKPGDGMKKISMKEDLSEIFGSDDLSEEFKVRTEALFEAAVQMRVELELAEIQESFESKATELEEEYKAALEEATQEILEDTEEKINDYLSYAVQEYMEENTVEIRNNLRVEVAESFLQGLKDLFVEHYVEVPGDKVDVVEELANRVDELEEEVNSKTEKQFELAKQIDEMQAVIVRNELAEGLTDTQKDKFFSLCENVEWNSVTEFETKAQAILESYVSHRQTSTEAQEFLNEEVYIEETPSKNVDPVMLSYAEALKRTTKR